MVIGRVAIYTVFAWYDFWVGLFYDTKKRILYVFPVPMFGIAVNFGRKIK